MTQVDSTTDEVSARNQTIDFLPTLRPRIVVGAHQLSGSLGEMVNRTSDGHKTGDEWQCGMLRGER